MFKWKDAFSVKVPEIDDQHKRLFAIANDINSLLKSYNGQDTYDEITTLIDELVDYTKYHFAHEEKLLLAHGYEGIDAHMEEHAQFVSYLESIDYDQIDANQQEAIKDLMNKVTAWVLQHVIDTDMKYSELLSKAMA